MVHERGDLPGGGSLGGFLIEAELGAQLLRKEAAKLDRFPADILVLEILRGLEVGPDDRAGLVDDDGAEFVQPGFMGAIELGVEGVVGGDGVGGDESADGGGEG